MPVGERHPLITNVLPGPMGSEELIAWQVAEAAQQGGGKEPSLSSDPSHKSTLVDKIESLGKWFRRLLPQDPSEIVVPRELMAQLDIALDRANRAQRATYEGEFDYSRNAQGDNHSTVRKLFIESGLNRVYNLKPDIGRLVYREKRRFQGRVEDPPLIRGDYVVFKVNPPLK